MLLRSLMNSLVVSLLDCLGCGWLCYPLVDVILNMAVYVGVFLYRWFENAAREMNREKRKGRGGVCLLRCLKGAGGKLSTLGL